MAGPKLPGELTWPKLLGTSIAAVVAAWLGSKLGFGGTLTGVAVGSIVATFGSAFFTTTLDKTHKAIPTVLVRTDRGTVIETRADQDVTVENTSDTTVIPAQPEPQPPAWGVTEPSAPSRLSQIDWKAVTIASLLTMAVTIGAISIYESAAGRTWGSNQPGTTLGNTVRGGAAPVAPSPTPTPSPTEEPTEEPTPSEEPTETPTPTEKPTDTPTPTETPTESPTPLDSPSTGTPPGITAEECPTPSDSPSQGSGLLR